MRVGDCVNFTEPPKFQWIGPAPSSSELQCKGGVTSENDEKPLEVPCSRIHHASCVLDKNVFLFGGKERYAPLKDLWKFDLENERWQLVELKETKIPHLQGHSMLAFRSQIFIFGGSFGENPDDIPLWIYNPDLGHVRKFTCDSQKPHPTGRRNHTSVLHKTCMYIFGGFQDSKGSSDELWSFDLEEEEWQSLHGPKDGKRHGHAAVVYGDALWVHGGLRELNCLSDLWVYNFKLCRWSKMKTIGKSPTLAHHTAHAFDNNIILIGGELVGGVFKSTPSSNIFLYSIRSKTWQQVETCQNHLFTSVFNHSSVLVDLNLILAGVKNKNCKSTPHLKSKTTDNVTIGVRPWTSPNLQDEVIDENIHMAMCSGQVNVLNLETVDERNSLLTDNNNNSEENIFSSEEFQNFNNVNTYCKRFSSEFTNMIEIKSEDCIHDDEGFEMMAMAKKNNATAEANGIHYASHERCDDDLSLLETFCSTDSVLYTRENGQFVSVSDENVFNHCNVVNSNKLMTTKEQFRYKNPAYLTSSSSNDSLELNSKCNFVNDLIILSGEQEKHELNNQIDRSLPISQTRNYIDEKMENTERGMTDSTVIPFQNDANTCLPLPTEHFQSLVKELDTINTQACKVFGDLVLEEVESNSNEVELNNRMYLPIALTCRSPSLKDVSQIKANSSEDDLKFHDPFYIESPVRTRSKSWTSLSSLSYKNDPQTQFLSRLIEKGKSSSISSLVPAQRTGKYAKHQNAMPLKDGLSVGVKKMRNQSSLTKMIQSKKSTLQQPSQLQITENYFNQNQTNKKSKISNSNSVTAKIFTDCKFVLFVFGGETKIPTFSKTPIHTWKCKIF